MLDILKSWGGCAWFISTLCHGLGNVVYDIFYIWFFLGDAKVDARDACMLEGVVRPKM